MTKNQITEELKTSFLKKCAIAAAKNNPPPAVPQSLRSIISPEKLKLFISGICNQPVYKLALEEHETKAKRAIFRPSCQLDFGLKNKNYFSSSMDSSDGLSTTLNEMSNQSKRRFVITQLPSGKDVFGFAKLNGLNANDLIFNGGEEYEIVATINPTHITKIKKYAKKNQVRLYEIGYVTNGKGVFYQKNGKLIRIRDEGWQHFQ